MQSNDKAAWLQLRSEASGHPVQRGIYIYICIYMYKYVYIYIYMCVCVCVCVCMYNDKAAWLQLRSEASAVQRGDAFNTYIHVCIYKGMY